MLGEEEDDGSWMMSILMVHQCEGPGVNDLRVPCKVVGQSILSLVGSALVTDKEVASGKDLGRSWWSWAHGLVAGDDERDEIAVQSEDQVAEGGGVEAEGSGGGDGERRKMSFPTMSW